MARITVEDSLQQAKNRFALVILTSKRARQLLKGSQFLIDSRSNREIVMSLREIAAGKVTFAHPEYLVYTKENFKPILDHTEFMEDDEYSD
jgi:DNA-directed RNA polymerase subunit omega